MVNKVRIKNRIKVLLGKAFPSRPDSLFSALRFFRSVVRKVSRCMAQELTHERLIADLRKAGICPGDVIMVHSSLSKVGKVAGGAETVVQSLIEAISPGGTLLMPSYCSASKVVSDLKQGIVPDLRKAKSETGLVTEVFRRWPGVHRSSHPFSPICAWGKKAKYIVRDHEVDPRIAHSDSPLARLRELGGKSIGIGVDIQFISIYHLVEDISEAYPFEVYAETVPITYVDSHGNQVERPISLYSPTLQSKRIEQWESAWLRAAMRQHLTTKGLLKTFTFGRAASWYVDAGEIYTEVKRLAEKGITIYLTQEEWEKRGESLESW